MVRWFMLSLGQLGDRAVLRVIAKSLGLTLAIFAALGTGLVLAVGHFSARFGLDAETGGVAQALAALASFAALWFLFRAVAVPVIGVFGDEIVAAVEERHYPAAHAVARKIGMGQSLRMGLASLFRLVGVNLLALPFHLLLLPTAIGPFALFVVLNALLLGRDMGEMVAARHLPRADMKQWLRNSRMERSLFGLIVTGLFMVPLANLFAPVIGAAMATHLFHGRRETH